MYPLSAASVLLFLAVTLAGPADDRRRDWTTHLITSAHNKYSVPNNVSKLYVNIQVHSFVRIANLIEGLGIELTMKLRWTVPEFAGWSRANSTLPVHIRDPSEDIINFWVPPHQFDSAIAVAKTDATRGASGTVLNIYNNGTVLFTKKVLATITCRMDFRAFPFDAQFCFLRLSTDRYPGFVPVRKSKYNDIAEPSFGNWAALIREQRTFNDYAPPRDLIVKVGTFILTFEVDTYDTLDDVECPDGETIEKCCPRCGTQPAWELQINMRRAPMTYVLKHTLPLIAITTCSLLSLWVDVNYAPVRATLTITTLLALLTFINAVEIGLPSMVMSHLTITGIYINLCLAFSCLTVFIFVFEAWVTALLKRKLAQRNAAKRKRHRENLTTAENIELETHRSGGTGSDKAIFRKNKQGDKLPRPSHDEGYNQIREGTDVAEESASSQHSGILLSLGDEPDEPEITVQIKFLLCIPIKITNRLPRLVDRYAKRILPPLYIILTVLFYALIPGARQKRSLDIIGIGD